MVHSATNHTPFEVFKRFKTKLKPNRMNKLIMENYDICKVWIDSDSKQLLAHYKLSESGRNLLRNQLRSNVEMYLKQRSQIHGITFNQTVKRQSRNYFYNHLSKSQGHLFKTGERVAILNPDQSKRRSKKTKVEHQK